LADDSIHPKALHPGDTVGLITSSTYVPDPDRLALADSTIKFFGLQVKIGKNVGKRMNDYRTSVDERLDDLHAMFRDKDVNAVLLFEADTVRCTSWIESTMISFAAIRRSFSVTPILASVAIESSQQGK
jgi:LD-carboxypeptidase N-terminal domain